MAQAELDFYLDKWLDVPPGTVRLRLLAQPPVVAGARVTVFARPTPPAHTEAAPWTRTVEANIDNMPATPAGESFLLTASAGNDYVIRFEGAAHLLMLGFNNVSVGFALSTPTSQLADYGGAHVAPNTRNADLSGNAWLHCA